MFRASPLVETQSEWSSRHKLNYPAHGWQTHEIRTMDLRAIVDRFDLVLSMRV